MKSLPGPVLADVAANVLAMTLMVLIALGRMISHPAPAPPPETLLAAAVPPMGGAAAVEALRQRLLPGPESLADIGPDPTTLPAEVSLLFILDPASYPQVQAEMTKRGAVWQELTVPMALKTEANRWHPEFLALAEVAADPDRFKFALQDLLARRSGTMAATHAAGGVAGSSLSLRFPHWFQLALDLIGLTALVAALWGLARLRRWAVKA